MRKLHKLSELMWDVSGGNTKLYKQLINQKLGNYNSLILDKLTNDKKKEVDVKASYNSDIDNSSYRKVNPSNPSPYLSKITGIGQNISNALRDGFHTDLDVAVALNISKRTADRMLHPTERYAHNRYFQHIIKVYGLIDDISCHWIRRKSKHPDKHHKWDWKLADNVVLGRYKPVSVVDHSTFLNYILKVKSPIEQVIDKEYKKQSKGVILEKLKAYRKKELFQRIKFDLLINLMKKYYMMKENNPKSVLDATNFSSYLSKLNKIYISLVYRAEAYFHNFGNWKMDVSYTKKGKEKLKSEDKYKLANSGAPDSFSLDSSYYQFSPTVSYFISSAMFYYHLYQRHHYGFISRFKQDVLHQVDKMLKKADSNPLFNLKYQIKYAKECVQKGDILLNTYHNRWNHLDFNLISEIRKISEKEKDHQ